MTEPRTLVRTLGAMAAALGALAFVVGAPVRSQRGGRDTVVSAATRDALDDCVESEASRMICTSAVQSISALQLAAWIRDGKPGLRVLDLRDTAAFETKHIPSAESFTLGELATVRPKPSETLVLYSDDDLRDAQGSAWLAGVGHARVHVVRGGMSAWLTEVLSPVVQGDSALAVAALSRYFGGVPRLSSPDDAARAAPRARVGDSKEVFDFVARRGC